MSSIWNPYFCENVYMKKIIFLIGLYISCVTTLLGQFKPVLGETFGNPHFYNYLTDGDKNEFLTTLKRLNIDTSKYLIIKDIETYFKHVKNDTIGGTIVSSYYLKNNKKISFSTRTRKKRGSPIETPVLYIRYWKDPDDDYLGFLMMTKS